MVKKITSLEELQLYTSQKGMYVYVPMNRYNKPIAAIVSNLQVYGEKISDNHKGRTGYRFSADESNDKAVLYVDNYLKVVKISKFDSTRFQNENLKNLMKYGPMVILSDVKGGDENDKTRN